MQGEQGQLVDSDSCKSLTGWVIFEIGSRRLVNSKATGKGQRQPTVHSARSSTHASQASPLIPRSSRMVRQSQAFTFHLDPYPLSVLSVPLERVGLTKCDRAVSGAFWLPSWQRGSSVPRSSIGNTRCHLVRDMYVESPSNQSIPADDADHKASPDRTERFAPCGIAGWIGDLVRLRRGVSRSEERKAWGRGLPTILALCFHHARLGKAFRSAGASSQFD